MELNPNLADSEIPDLPSHSQRFSGIMLAAHGEQEAAFIDQLGLLKMYTHLPRMILEKQIPNK